MCQIQKLRDLVDQRLNAAVEEIFGVFKRIIAEYEEELSRTKEQLDAVKSLDYGFHKAADVLQVSIKTEEEEVSSEEQEWSFSVEQEELEPPHIKEEEEEPWQQLQWLGEADDEDEPQSLLFHHSQWEADRGGELLIHQITTEDDEEHCEDINSEPGSLFAPLSDLDDMMSDSSETADHSDDTPLKSMKGSKGDRHLNVDQHFECSQCGKTFGQKGYLIRHMITHSGKKPFSCPFCAKRFFFKEYLTRHMTVHKKEHAGSHADSNFAPLSDMNNMASDSSVTDHSEDTKEPSESNKDSQGDRRRHTKHKPFECPQCGKTFTKKGNMIVHMRKHTEVKRFACSVCSKQFLTRGYINKHMRIHTGEKPFHCGVCNRRFTFKEGLRQHQCSGDKKPNQ
ncbi:zinc finger protein 32-like isoform X1 [Entelurus aequoreus]|uniref:zinc finger protein 32-like isoform X1 n=1 Tax=Entelurus aequoreus TaxID=161455 RepID=UPI002B1DF9F2|nr:zinc finger protein 32-like isoform X1 [Entelurus aequoreus]